ncbi:hypothetical protein LIER_12544 [Lithospermum erythrorhizon]|uniref:RNase H type-1 domain-containing protein n=1 Tax=Lithospermum erythrorhizon TaxID=34254 RepID=A0AAV3PV78_LITER
MIVGLRLVKSLDMKEVLVKGDSKLVIDQIRGVCEVKPEILKKYHAKAISITQGFRRVVFEHIPREENEEADCLSRLATTYYSDLPRGVYVEICDSLVYEEEYIQSIFEADLKDWKTPIVQFLTADILPLDKYEAKKIQNRSFRLQIYQEKLYKKSWDGPLLLCVSAKDIPRVLVEIHERWCGSHIGARSLAIKVTRAGYYWPTVANDYVAYVKKCDACQRLGNSPQLPTWEAPFSLVYGTETVFLVEVGLPTYRQAGFDEENNDKQLREYLNFTDELRDEARYKILKYKCFLARAYNRRVKNLLFAVGDLVLRLFSASHPKEQSKLSPVTYELRDLEGKPIPRTWHASKLSKYYV